MRARESEREANKTAVLGKTFTKQSVHKVVNPALSSLKQSGIQWGTYPPPPREKQDSNQNIYVEAGGLARWRGTRTLGSWPGKNQRQDFARRDTVPKPMVLSFVACVRVGHLCVQFRYYLFYLCAWMDGWAELAGFPQSIVKSHVITCVLNLSLLFQGDFSST